MHLGDDVEVVDIGDAMVVMDDDIIDPDLEIDPMVCVGCDIVFTKKYQLDKKGMCIDCSEDSINLSELQRYKDGGNVLYDEGDFEIEMDEVEDEIEPEMDDYIDSNEITEDGYDMFEDDYSEWMEDYQAENAYEVSNNNYRYLLGALGLGGLAVLFAPDKVREFFKRK